MLDYVAWLDRLRRFIAAMQAKAAPEDIDQCYIETEEPMSREDIDWLRSNLECPLPEQVERFLTQAASSVQFGYVVTQSDGSKFEHEDGLFYYMRFSESESTVFTGREAIAGYQELCADSAVNGWLTEKEWPLDRAFWKHALPLTCNGADGLAVSAHAADDPHPPVIFLEHEGESYLVSPTFDDFLIQWEKLGYCWSEDFRNSSGFLDADCPAAVKFREPLGLKTDRGAKDQAN